MQTSHSTSSRALSFAEFRTLALASLGGALEFYDFVIFVFFTAVIGKLFFSAGLPDWMRELQTFGIFAAGYLARPLGGVVIAHFGDMARSRQPVQRGTLCRGCNNARFCGYVYDADSTPKEGQER
jgi:MFS family permease